MFAGVLLRIVLIAGLNLPMSWALAQSNPTGLALTEEERAWISRNPVLRVSVLDNLDPIEYLRGSRAEGLSAGFLNEISRKTGLKFTFRQASTRQERVDLLQRGEVDVISAMRVNGEGAAMPGLLHTAPYHVSAGIIITRTNKPFVIEADQLNGMTVTLPVPSLYAEEVKRKAPNVNLIVGGSARTMLQQVLDGEADAAVGTEAYLVPYLYREHRGQLQISGVWPGMTTEIGMSVRDDQPELHSILQKALAAITPAELRQLHDDWLGIHMKEEPTLINLVEDYPHELVLVGVVLLLLSAVAVQMHRTRQRAERNEREKTMFLAVMSHEIRSPMNSVLAAVELLRNTPLGEQQRHYADLANNGAQSLLTLIDDVLDVTKLEAGQLKLELDPVDISALVRNTVELHQLRARERHLSLSYQGDPDPPLLMLDDARLGQVLHNLVSNAIKFTETGGVTVRYSVSESAIPKHVALVISVSDTGIGISDEAQLKLFQPYAQVTRTYRRSGGTGLGLAISRDLVTLMQGRISLRSAVGEGTTFEVHLPVMLAPKGAAIQTEAAQPVPDGAKPASGLRVLVVEDTAANQAVLQAQLESFGCTAVIAQNGTQALDCFSQGTYDVVLMDCDLPDCNGYTLTADFRKMEETAGQAHCPIIAISASTGSEHVAKCFDAGMDGILSKPIRSGKLQDTIELWCGVVLEKIVPPTGSNVGLSMEQVIESLRQDVFAILESAALRDTDATLRATHRLRGAALAVEWIEVAQAVDAIAALLEAELDWSDPQLSDALHDLVICFSRSHALPEAVAEEPRLFV
ncbi:ATP-binding protein [Achromobacter spanius]|uniref:ATP-binding protein n=1 Tax=Achromobacter spanius TaxID=217203 RepID=UPI0038074867